MILPRLNIKLERWKWNKEFRVYVSTKGNFKNERKEIIPFKISADGYVNVRTCRGYVSAHRLVMFTWRPIANRENMTVDHLNHNKRDNSLDNLEWVTRQENMKRASSDYIQKTYTKEDCLGDIEIIDFPNKQALYDYFIRKYNKDISIIGAEYNRNIKEGKRSMFNEKVIQMKRGFCLIKKREEVGV